MTSPDPYADLCAKVNQITAAARMLAHKRRHPRRWAGILMVIAAVVLNAVVGVSDLDLWYSVVTFFLCVGSGWIAAKWWNS